MTIHLQEFRIVHDKITTILSDALKYGPTPKLDIEYRRQRAWMLSHYESLRPDLAPYLDGTENGSDIGLRTADAMEKLIEPPTLRQVLQGDPTRILARIAFTREAIELCAGEPASAIPH